MTPLGSKKKPYVLQVNWRKFPRLRGLPTKEQETIAFNLYPWKRHPVYGTTIKAHNKYVLSLRNCKFENKEIWKIPVLLIQGSHLQCGGALPRGQLPYPHRHVLAPAHQLLAVGGKRQASDVVCMSLRPTDP